MPFAFTPVSSRKSASASTSLLGPAHRRILWIAPRKVLRLSNRSAGSIPTNLPWTPGGASPGDSQAAKQPPRGLLIVSLLRIGGDIFQQRFGQSGALLLSLAQDFGGCSVRHGGARESPTCNLLLQPFAFQPAAQRRCPRCRTSSTESSPGP